MVFDRGFCVVVKVIFFCAAFREAHSVTRTDIENIHQTLFSRTNGTNSFYLTDIRPSPRTVIAGSLQLYSIGGLDEISGKFSTLVSLTLSWHDERLHWNSSTYGWVHNISVKQKKIWTPMILVRNPVQKRTHFGLRDNMAIISNNGEVHLTIDDYLETVCNFDVTHFPFDEQICDIEFLAWIYASVDVDFHQKYKDIDMELYSENGMWEVLETSATVKYYHKYSIDFATLKYTIKLKRQPGYFILSIFVPVIMLMLLNSVVFILPTDSGERVGYAITCLLSLAVFLSLTSDVLPKTSSPLSVLSCFLMLLVLVSAAICLLTIISLWLCHKDDKSHMPLILKKFTYFVHCRGSKIGATSEATERTIANKTKDRGNLGIVKMLPKNGRRMSIKSTKSSIASVKSYEKEPIEMEAKETKYSEIGWKQFSEVFDLVGFILTISVTGTLGFLYVTIAGGNL